MEPTRSIKSAILKSSAILFIAGIAALLRYPHVKSILQTALCNLKSCSALAQSWPPPLAEWHYRTVLTLNHAGAAINNFPARVKLAPGNFNYAHAKADGADIRFADNAGNLLPYEIENWNPGGTSNIWVKTSVSSGGSVILYTGNLNAVDAQRRTDVWSEYLTVFHLNEPSGDMAYDSSPNQLHATVYGEPTRGLDQGFVGPGYHVRFEDQICLNEYASSRAPFNEGTYSLMLNRAWSDHITGRDNSHPFGYYQIGGMYSGWYIPPGGTIDNGCDAGLEFFWNYVAQDFRDDPNFDPNDPNHWDNYNVLFTNGCNPNKDANFYRDNNDEHLAVPQDTWTLVTLTWSDAQGQFKFFADGSLVYQDRWSPVGPANTPLQYWAVAGNPYCGNYQGMVAGVDEVRFANHPKSPEWVSADGRSMAGTLFRYGAEEKKF